jgi:hypothetical protein
MDENLRSSRLVDSRADWEWFRLPVMSVPEPPGLLLLASGAGMLILIYRRYRPSHSIHVSSSYQGERAPGGEAGRAK